MQNEIKIGEYVRDIDGIIVKIQGKIGNEYVIKPFKGKIYTLTEKQLLKDIVKHSKNIIDLIEKSDLIKYKNNNTINIVRVGNTERLQDMFDNFEIISILTHEQFASMEYKVGV